jgi:hypothetical protein
MRKAYGIQEKCSVTHRFPEAMRYAALTHPTLNLELIKSAFLNRITGLTAFPIDLAIKGNAV